MGAFEEVIGDYRLIRYLRAFQYNVDEASERWLKFIDWRIEKGVDKIRQEIVANNWTPAELPHSRTMTSIWNIRMYWSRDKEGNPIVNDCLGTLDPTAVLEAFENDTDAIVTWWIHVMEHKQLLLDRLSREAGHLVFCYEIKALLLLHFARWPTQCLTYFTYSDRISTI